MIAISAAVFMFFGILSNSTLVAVILILYVRQNLTVPMLPTILQLETGYHGLMWLGTAVATIAVVLFGGMRFRRSEF